MWNGQTIAVILPTFNEAGSIHDCILGFEKLGFVDEIIVVNNNAHPDTSPAVAGTTAREVFETTQGYGAAIRRGFKETKSYDLVAVCEPDATFDPADLYKLLPFLSDSDAVFGSRTVATFIIAGANMDELLRWGNWAVAKMVEVAFNTVYLSDVGCTFRVLRRHVIDRIEPRFEGNGSSFGLEMMLYVIAERFRCVQVPVRYLPRVGESSVTGERSKAVKLGFEMIWLAARVRRRTIGKRPPPQTGPHVS
jgi:dolichol-phosphate mannosyltransferase